METKSPQDIAKAIGVDPKLARGTMEWPVPTHSWLTFSELNLGETLVPFRVRNSRTNEVFTKLLDEPYIVDPKQIDDLYDKVMQIGILLNTKIDNAVLQALPELVGNAAAQMQGSDGKLYLADVGVSGELENFRLSPDLPKSTWTEDEGFKVDASMLTVDQQIAVAAAVKKVDNENVVAVVHSDEALKVINP